jgi:hypothetical protein
MSPRTWPSRTKVISARGPMRLKSVIASEPATAAFSSITELEAFTADLALVADWRDDLRGRIHRAALRLELCGLYVEEVDELVEEVSAFTSLCHAMEYWLKTRGGNGGRAESSRKVNHCRGRHGRPPRPDVEPRGSKRGKRKAEHSATNKVRRLATSVVAAPATKGRSTS